MSVVKKVPLPGGPFIELLGEMNTHALGKAGNPEADEYVLSQLIREYLAYVLALYYQCEHCEKHHGQAFGKLLVQEGRQGWSKKWRDSAVDASLFLRHDQKYLSKIEFERWMRLWNVFALSMDMHEPHLACLSAFAIAIARNDKALVALTGQSLKRQYPDKSIRHSMVRDVLRVVLFMKSAATLYRVQNDIIREFDL